MTDGLCAGVCARFVRLMEDLGVKSIVLGGFKNDDVMQAVGGGKGYALFFNIITSDMLLC